MPFKFFAPIFCLSLFFANSVFAEADFVAQAQAELSRQEWDQAERIYLRASQNVTVEDRIAAWDGLVKLYQKVRLFKKAQKAQGFLEQEKKFLQNLVPAKPKYYQNYHIQPGDTYGKIAKKNKVSEKWLMRINSNKKLIAGKSILLPTGKYDLVIHKDERRLFWIREGELLRAYPVAVGKPGTETPEGEFEIAHKVKNPIWYFMKEQIQPGDPKNLLGTRWLGLNHKGYGIHGTKAAGNVGKAVSHGCIRMKNRDIEELFEWVPIGTKVIIANKKTIV